MIPRATKLGTAPGDARLQIEPWLRNVRKEPSMRGTRAMLTQCRQVLGGGVALVPREAIRRIASVELDQHGVAPGLGQDRCRRDGSDQAVAVDGGARRIVERGAMHAVDPDDLGLG